MVEANRHEFPALPQDEALLQDYLNDLVADRLYPGAQKLLEGRV